MRVLSLESSLIIIQVFSVAIIIKFGCEKNNWDFMIRPKVMCLKQTEFERLKDYYSCPHEGSPKGLLHGCPYV